MVTKRDAFQSAVTSYISNILINSQDMEENRRIFNEADMDKSGTLNFEELATAMRKVQSLKHLEEAKLRKIFNEVDTNESGEIEFNEFC